LRAETHDSGIEPVFEGMDDIQFRLKGTLTLDGRILVIDYAPGGTLQAPSSGSSPEAADPFGCLPLLVDCALQGDRCL
jgi:hypothetical protein